MIPKFTIARIMEESRIDEVVGEFVTLKKRGASLIGNCPFHNEKTASFFISADRGNYYCFGCGAKGDIFTFVEEFEGLDFKGALKILAERQKHYMNEFVSFIRDTPEQRYLNLLHIKPHIIQRVPQHYIASYLGISRVHLSRIKSKLAKGKLNF